MVRGIKGARRPMIIIPEIFVNNALGRTKGKKRYCLRVTQKYINKDKVLFELFDLDSKRPTYTVRYLQDAFDDSKVILKQLGDVIIPDEFYTKLDCDDPEKDEIVILINCKSTKVPQSNGLIKEVFEYNPEIMFIINLRNRLCLKANLVEML